MPEMEARIRKCEEKISECPLLEASVSGSGKKPKDKNITENGKK
jgi:hypothetical protein